MGDINPPDIVEFIEFDGVLIEYLGKTVKISKISSFAYSCLFLG